MTPYLTQGAILIATFGTPSQKERLQAGVLPQEEFDGIVRDHLFAALGPWPRFKKIKPQYIRELAILRGRSDGSDEVEFDTVPADELASAEWSDLKKIQAMFPDAKEIVALWTVATCGDQIRKFPKARITIEYYGRIFQQEVKLG